MGHGRSQPVVHSPLQPSERTMPPLKNLDRLWLDLPGSMSLALAANALWFVAYVLIIVRCFREKTYGVPLVAAATNLSWEFIFGFLLPPPMPEIRYSSILWCVTDVLIAYQVLRYGAREQVSAIVQRRFQLIATLTFPAAFLLLHTFIVLANDALGMVSALLTNVAMSALFINMFLQRPGGRGLSYGAAWCKGLGTFLNLPALYFISGYVYPSLRLSPFILASGLIIAVLDGTYIYLLHLRCATPTP